MTLLRFVLAVGALVGAGACASRSEEPLPAPAPAPRPVLVAPRVPVVPDLLWPDAPLAPGDWSQEGSEARYGPAGAPSFAVRCAGPGRLVLIRHGGSTAPAMIVRTTSQTRTLPARAGPGGVEAQLAASDPLLDAMLFSRGRYSVEVPGLDRLIVPSWPEPARVIEDCRS
ncbi:MAG TPA: hypothetical protein VF702_04755 [Allosphingosinicella sp.]|jgi:hypothetical protein